MKSVTEILQEAHDILAKPKAWTKGYFAYNSLDKGKRGIVQAGDPSAVCWCAAGACRKAAGSYAEAMDAEELLHSLVPGKSLFEWNDKSRRTKAEVLDLFKKAIRKAKKEGL